jgi:hypothetical protein
LAHHAHRPKARLRHRRRSWRPGEAAARPAGAAR